MKINEQTKINENLWALTSHWAAITSTEGWQKCFSKSHQVNPQLTPRGRGAWSQFIQHLDTKSDIRLVVAVLQGCNPLPGKIGFPWVSHSRQGKWKRLGMCKVHFLKFRRVNARQMVWKNWESKKSTMGGSHGAKWTERRLLHSSRWSNPDMDWWFPTLQPHHFSWAFPGHYR